MNTTTLLRIMMVLLLAGLLLIILMIPAYCGTTGIISGTVTNLSTGEKLSGARVQIDDNNLYSTSNADGYYVITDVAPGDHRISVSLDGYTPQQAELVSVVMDVTSNQDFKLEPTVSAEEKIVVTEAKPVIQRDVVPTMYVVDSKREKMVQGNPDTLYQIPGIVTTQPGVIADADGWPHIRGGRANQIGYMIDGIPVTEPVTNGFGTNAATVGMDKMEIFTGGYRPEYGNAISGIFNQVIKTGKNSGGRSLQLLGGSDTFKGIYPEIGGELTNGADYYLSGYSWHSKFEGTDYNEADASDFVGKLNYPLSENNKLTLLTVRGSALYKFPYEHTQTLDQNITDATTIIDTNPEKDHSHQRYAISSLAFTHNFDSNSFLTVRPYTFINKWNFDALSDFETGIGVWVKGESKTTGLMLDYANQLNQKHLLKAGAIRMSADNIIRSAVPDMYEYDYIADTDTLQTGLYLQDQIRLNSVLGLELGLRYDRMHYDIKEADNFSESQTSPRFGLSYALNPKTNLRFSYGKMIQFVHTQAIYRKFINPFWQEMYPNPESLRPERSTQYDIGCEHQLNSDYSLQFTPFYRKFNDLLQTTSINPEMPDAPPYIYENLGEGTSRGIELLFRKRPSKNWSGWLSYTLSHAEASSSGTGLITPGEKYDVDWDQRHTAVIVLNYMRNGWTYSFMGDYGSGLPYTLADQTRNSSRVSSHTTFNINISKDVNGGLFSDGEIHLGIANIFNSGAVLMRDESGEPLNRISPRFISFTYTRKL